VNVIDDGTRALNNLETIFNLKNRFFFFCISHN
jgi:hypothetical protein